MYICLNACMYVCIHVYKNICMDECIYVQTLQSNPSVYELNSLLGNYFYGKLS